MKKLILLSTICAIIASCGSSNNNKINNSKELKLNFKNFSSLKYAFKQKSKSVQYFMLAEGELPDTNQSFINGNILLKNQGDSLASLSFQNLTLRNLFGNKKDTSSQQIPTQVIQGFNQYGENQLNSGYNQKFTSFFPLPYRITQMENNVFKFPITMPFNANGSALLVNGECVFTILDTIKYDNYNCLKIRSISTYNNLEIPETLEGQYFCESSLIFNGLFAYEEGYFINGKVKAITEYRIETPNSNSEKNSKMEMYSSDEFEYELLK